VIRSVRPAVLALIAAGAATVMLAAGAEADGGRVSPQYQAYSAPGGQDPYAQSNPQDVHVSGYGGQPVVTGYIKLNLESLPSGSAIEGLLLKVVPNSSPQDNVNSAAAAIEACPLSQPLASSGYQSNPPPSDCNQHVTGEPQADGSWQFELGPLAQHWAQGSNDGVALTAYGENSTPAGSVSPSAWSVAFDHTKTAATVQFVPGQSSTSSFFAPAPATVGGGSTSLALPPAPNNPAPAPAAAPPATSQQPATAQQAAGPVIVMQPKAQRQWLWLTIALAGAAVLMVVVGAAQHAFRSGRLQLGPAIAASRSQLATPVAVLALAAVFALGSTTQLVPTVVSGRAGLPGTAGGGALGGTNGVPGSGAAAGGATGPAGVSGGTAASASGAAASNTNGGQDGPGVTSTTVRIGFVYVVNGQAANQAFGIKAPSTGNEQSEEQAMVDYVNHHGGIAGRQVQPVYVAYDNSKAETDPTIGEEICHTMTEDYHVFAVVGGGGPPDAASADACYAQAGTLNFELGVSGGADQAFLQRATPYIWLVEDATLDRTMTWEIAGLRSRGFFSGGPSYKLGVVVAQDPINERIYKDVTLPGLQAAGVQNPEEFEVPHDTVSDIANTMKQAVVHFQATGVTNVIFQGGGNYGQGSYAVLFMLDAESQHYNPIYGFSTEDGFGQLANTVPQDQFNHALAVGWLPATDTNDAQYAPFPYTSGEKLCEGIMSASGNGSSTRANAAASLTICDGVLQVQQAARALTGQPLNAQLLGDQFMREGSSVFSSLLTRAYYGAGRWDAPGGYRLLHAVLNCSGGNACFEFDNSNVYS
jgi:hypothetical protein